MPCVNQMVVGGVFFDTQAEGSERLQRDLLLLIMMMRIYTIGLSEKVENFWNG